MHASHRRPAIEQAADVFRCCPDVGRKGAGFTHIAALLLETGRTNA